MISRRLAIVAILMLAGFTTFVTGVVLLSTKESVESSQFTIVIVGGSIMFGTAVLWFISECLKVRAAVLAEPLAQPLAQPLAPETPVIQPRLSKSVSFENLEPKTPIIRVVRGQGMRS
jgi:hypothetical protein